MGILGSGIWGIRDSEHVGVLDLGGLGHPGRQRSWASWTLGNWGILGCEDHGHPRHWGSGASWAVRIMGIRDTGCVGLDHGHPGLWVIMGHPGLRTTGHPGLWVCGVSNRGIRDIGDHGPPGLRRTGASGTPRHHGDRNSGG